VAEAKALRVLADEIDAAAKTEAVRVDETENTFL
jgi:hypothetical protein